MSNEDFEGTVPNDGASRTPDAPAGTPESIEQQLAKERDARAMMRDRLRHTEALAAESQALRARMAEELERVTADRDRLRTAAANAPAGSTASAAPVRSAPSPAGIEPQFTPRMAPHSDGPLKPPAPPVRSGPWRALAMLGGLAAGVACLAWIIGTLPGESGPDIAAAASAALARPAASTAEPALAQAGPGASASTPALAMASPASVAIPPPTGSAVALPPLAPERQLAAAPTAAGSAPTPAAATAAAPVPAPTATPADMPARLRTALDSEGIATPVDIDAATGHVTVADPQADAATRDRTDLVIRAVYAGASLPEPQIEHRWLSPQRGERAAPVAAASGPAARSAATATLPAAAAYAARHAAAERATGRRKATAATVADAEELRPVLPEGRVTAGCRASLAGKGAPHRADMTACMKHSCCSSSGNHQSEECRAYEKAYPFTCGAG